MRYAFLLALVLLGSAGCQKPIIESTQCCKCCGPVCDCEKCNCNSCCTCCVK